MKHVHIYFRPHQKEEALALKAKIACLFPQLTIGRFHEKPVGPHTTGSFLVHLKTSNDERALKFFLKNKIGTLSAMIHPETGDDARDHAPENIEWIGEEVEINRSIFNREFNDKKEPDDHDGGSPNKKKEAKVRIIRAVNCNIPRGFYAKRYE